MKRKRNGFTFLYDATRHVDAAFVRQDEADWLVILPIQKYLELLKGV